jgi:uncharacterized YigZ family protein
MQEDIFKTIAKTSEGFYKEKGSKFLAFAFPVKSEEEIKEIQKDLRKKYYDARHHVYAFRLGVKKDVFRASDDGEPSNSSGPPILGQIRSYDLTDILIVVIRYFGGTKLGVPGLINAYKTAASDSIEKAKIIEKTDDVIIDVFFEYPQMNDVMHIAKEENVNQLEHDFQVNCRLRFSIRRSLKDQVLDKFKLIHQIDFKEVVEE